MNKNYITFRTTPTSDGQPRWAVQATDGYVLGFITRERGYYIGVTQGATATVSAPRLQQTAAMVAEEAARQEG